MRRRTNSDNINHCFSILEVQIRNAKCLNLQDLGIYMENFFRDLLNMIYTDRSFRNLNMGEGNFAAIDLGDNLNDIAIQVTSTTDRQKVVDTLKKYGQGDGAYKRIIMLYSSSGKPVRNKDFNDVLPEGVTLTEWDFSDLYKEIYNISGNGLDAIALFIETEVLAKSYRSKKELTEEIEAIVDVVEYLSINSKKTHLTFDEELVDPEGKIRGWFKELHKTVLNTYSKLSPYLSAPLHEARSQFMEDDELKSVSIAEELKDLSIKYLREENGDAWEALEKMVDHLLNFVTGSKKRQAVKFFLVDEMIRCNVFPIEVMEIYGINI